MNTKPESTIVLQEWVNQQIGKNRQYSSNYEFAKASGISESTVRRLRLGDHPSVGTIHKMAEHLNYPIETLLSTNSPEKTDAIARIDIVVPQLSPEDQDDVLDFAMRLLKRRKR